MKEKYIDDLKEIRHIMNQSSRFVSLSGVSGVSVGLTALLGVYLTNLLVFTDYDHLSYSKVFLQDKHFTLLLLIAFGTIALGIGQVILFTTRKTRRLKMKIWDHQTRRILINLSIPLLTGGIVSLILLFEGFIGMVYPFTLIFYGLALVNVSKYTLNEIRSLGLLEISLGLIAFQFIELGLINWSIGFGVLHVAYGLLIHKKYPS